MVIIFFVCPVPDKRHLMTKMSSTLRRSENCSRGRKSRVSSQSAAGDLYCAIISTLHILSQDAVFIERSSIQEAVLFVLLYSKSVQDLTPKHKIICSSLQIYLRKKLSPRFICIPVMLLLDKHQCTSDLLYLQFVFVFVFAKHTSDNTNDNAVQVRTLHTGRGAGCHLISFSRPAQSKFEVQPPPEHHDV